MKDDLFDESDQSEFNFGISTLQRIHLIKQELDIITVFPEPRKHFKLLKAFYKELRPMIKDEEKTEQDDKLNYCNKQYSKYIKERNANVKITAEVNIFDIWEFDLRDLDQKYGLNMPKKRDPRFALARR